MNPIPVKALIVRSPWAQEIADGSKPIEYRCWRTHYRGWLAVVAARRRESGSDAGRAVCLVRLTDCVEIAFKDYEWLLADPIPLTERIEIPGRLGLFDVTELLAGVIPSIQRPMPSNPAPAVSTPESAMRVSCAKASLRTRREIHQFLPRFEEF